MPSVSAIVGGVVAGAVVVGGGAVAYSALTADPPGQDQAEVVRVIDGDTIDVRYDGTKHRIRLLNIDTPETKDPHKTVECLGPEATAFLEEMLQPGDRVRLEFDVDLLDPYDRELAGVFEDDVLINAEIARHGLGVPVVFEPNRKFYDEVASAFEESKAARTGMFDPKAECTVAARADAVAEKVAALKERASSAAPEETRDSAQAIGVEVLALLALIEDSEPLSLRAGGLDYAELATLRSDATALQRQVKKIAAAAEKAIEKAEARAKREAAEKARQEAEEEAKRKAEKAQQKAEEAARREAERRAEEAARSAPLPPAPQPAPQPVPQPEPAPEPSPGLPGAGYTGCRAYIGGPYIDDKGRHYTPIDCETKLPLVP